MDNIAVALALDGPDLVFPADAEEAGELLRQVLTAGSASRCPRAPARTLVRLGTVYNHLGEPDLAEQQFRAALELEGQTDHLRGIGAALGGIGDARQVAGRYRAAETFYARALGCFIAAGRGRGERQMWRRIGEARLKTDAYINAIEAVEKAAGIPLDEPTEDLQSRELTVLGLAYLGLGDGEHARELLLKNLELTQRTQLELEQARIEVALADVEDALNDRDAEVGHLLRAHELYTRHNVVIEAFEIRTRIRALILPDPAAYNDA